MDGYPKYRSHFLPRSPSGRVAAVLFFLLLALAQPPFVHAVVNRMEPWVFGLPFLYAWLLVVYAALIAVLIWAVRQDV